jgi:two-component system KDP operon response regulator KdpE
MSTSRPTILVIDDEPQIRRFLRATLNSDEFMLLEAETAA